MDDATPGLYTYFRWVRKAEGVDDVAFIRIEAVNASTSPAVIKPDVGIAIESGVTDDVGGPHAEECQVKLGSGPGTFLYDSIALPNRKLVALVREAARTKSIPLETALMEGYGDDSAEMRPVDGAPMISSVMPARYTHVNNGIMNRGDFDGTVDLVVALVQGLYAGTVARLGDFTLSRSASLRPL